MTTEALARDAQGSRQLLIEIVRRAAYDWVTYRASRRLSNRIVARDAYEWLFNEQPGHPDWEERKKNGYGLFSFVSICEVLDLDPEYVRGLIKVLTYRQVQSIGRPRANGRRTKETLALSSSTVQHRDAHLLPEGDLEDTFPPLW